MSTLAKVGTTSNSLWWALNAVSLLFAGSKCGTTVRESPYTDMILFMEHTSHICIMYPCNSGHFTTSENEWNRRNTTKLVFPSLCPLKSRGEETVKTPRPCSPIWDKWNGSSGQTPYPCPTCPTKIWRPPSPCSTCPTKIWRPPSPCPTCPTTPTCPNLSHLFVPLVLC